MLFRSVLFEKYSDTSDFMIMNLTKYEFSTVLSRKLPQLEAIKIYKEFTKDFQNEIWFEISWESEVFDLYNSFEKKNISFFDCACMILAKKINSKIASFDNFYPSELLA